MSDQIIKISHCQFYAVSKNVLLTHSFFFYFFKSNMDPTEVSNQAQSSERSFFGYELHHSYDMRFLKANSMWIVDYFSKVENKDFEYKGRHFDFFFQNSEN